MSHELLLAAVPCLYSLSHVLLPVPCLECAPREAFFAVCDNNIRFTEHVDTTLSVGNDPQEHKIGCDQPVVVAAAPSTRKSHLIELTDSFLTSSPQAEQQLRDEAFFLREATNKGVRTLLHACHLSEESTPLESLFRVDWSGWIATSASDIGP